MANTVAQDLEPVIGLEVHVQLLTQSKMFCRCAADYQAAEPNTRVCPICLGMPGVLPVINRKAVEFTIMTGLALHCQVLPLTKFDRKNYPYPDLMKGYQISQYDLPLTRNGWLEIDIEGEKRRIGITRVHLEEDTARLVHRFDFSGDSYSLVDVNRSGVPLMEVVGEPDLRSPEEARLYLVKLRTILLYLGVSTGNMEEGSFRCDANISLRPPGTPLPKSKVEVKNMNSFRAVYHALQYETERQREVLASGGTVAQETRGWVEERSVTVSQRSKEYAHDYRYFPEPDLPPLAVHAEWVEEIRRRLPELPDERRERFIRGLGLPVYDATLLTQSKATADYFEGILDSPERDPTQRRQRAKIASNWVLSELAGLLNATGKEPDQSPLSPKALAGLLDLLEAGTISGRMAKEVFEEMFRTGKSAEAIVREKGLHQVNEESELLRIVEEVIAGNPQAVADYRKGKQTAAKFLVGQVMKATRGQANPQVASGLVTRKLGEQEA
ncbi:MAG: Asp-tRNA(Asn)/Glu-tRNA(Gln) amidotransferase subunit GatB [Chloroflexi bacterium]|nr:Asp-tRNA(Asn)/Glu-tRNA(Gln) amidotransferase subunit GatB [Chloroflexota bacterium]